MCKQKGVSNVLNMPILVKLVKLPGTSEWKVNFEGVHKFRCTIAIQTVDHVHSSDQSLMTGQILRDIVDSVMFAGTGVQLRHVDLSGVHGNQKGQVDMDTEDDVIMVKGIISIP
jgi:hypothetical protein